MATLCRVPSRGTGGKARAQRQAKTLVAIPDGVGVQPGTGARGGAGRPVRRLGRRGSLERAAFTRGIALSVMPRLLIHIWGLFAFSNVPVAYQSGWPFIDGHRDRQFRLSGARFRIDERLGFDAVLQGVLDSARCSDSRPVQGDSLSRTAILGGTGLPAGHASRPVCTRSNRFR